jgi:hypothetical protein
MKKVLLATTAIVSAGMLAGAGEVAAQDKPISLSLSGYYRAAFGVMTDDDGAGQRGAGFRNHQISQDVEVHFKGETTLARGITVGVTIELEAQEQAGDQIDETWAYIKGRWGELRFGDEDNVVRLSALSSPTPGDNFGANSPFFAFNNSGTTITTTGVGSTTGTITNSTSLGLTNDSTKIIYFTPRISGFQLGVSYAPDGTQDVRTLSQGGRGKTAGIGQEFAIAGTYSGKLGPVDLGVQVGYQRATNETPGGTNEDPSGYTFGLSVGYMGWQVAGSFQQMDDRGGTRGRESTVWDAGIAYMPGPWGAGFSYSRGTYDVGAQADDKLQVFNFGGRYILGPGIRLNAAIEHVKYDPGRLSATVDHGNYDATAFMIGTTIIF